ncbi:MAG: DEAD/DEAH box helicase [Acidimicrobiales bacterium]
MPDEVFGALVDADIDRRASAAELAVLRADEHRWRSVLYDRLDEAEDALDHARALTGPERDLVVADFETECADIEAALARLDLPAGADALDEVGSARLQLSWTPGRVVAWVGGADETVTVVDDLRAALAAVGAPAAAWADHAPVGLPDGRKAAALAAPISEALGWLLGCASDERVGASTRWMGRLGLFAMNLVARGSVVPLLRHRHRTQGSGTFAVRWHPVNVDDATMATFVDAMPGAVMVADASMDAASMTRSAFVGAVDAVCAQAARLVEVPAAPPKPVTPSDIAEAYLASLDGTPYRAPVDKGQDLVRALDQWARPVTEPLSTRMVVRLEPPDSSRAWALQVLAADPDGVFLPAEKAMASHPSNKIRARANRELERAEELIPELRRAGSQWRGEAVLTDDEAWHLMTETGPALDSAGFDVQIPRVGRAPKPTLRLTALDDRPTTSAADLSRVRWSVLFDDVELTAAEIVALAKQAAPLVQSNGRWVRLSDTDVQAAAEALRDRADTMTGGEMLRWAVGLHGSPLAGGVSVANGWAADIIDAAGSASTREVTEPDGFSGQLRSYQREALGWLQFCDSAGLSGCLALDMGLGKTPTVLAHVAGTCTEGPTLVIAPPAVVGNWRAEAHKFVPDLRVTVHHGASRATHEEIAAEVADADLVVTTYGTALRDLEALCDIAWHRVVLDEAQAIKNPASEAARGLRTIPSRHRLAMTGTPVENGLGDLWAILDYANPGLVGDRAEFVGQLGAANAANGSGAEGALRALNGLLVFRRTKAEPEIAAELPDRIDETDHCTMTAEQIGLYQAVLDKLLVEAESGAPPQKGHVLGAITNLKQICNHPAAFTGDDQPLGGRSGKLARLDDIVDTVFAVGERIVVFTQYARWAIRLAEHLTARTGTPVAAYHGGLPRKQRDQIIDDFQRGEGAAALVLSLKAGGAGLNLTAANHVVLFDRWWNPAVEDQARDRAWRLGQERTVIFHRLECPGTIDERVEEVVAGKRHVADLVLPKSSSLDDLSPDQLRIALGLRESELLTDDGSGGEGDDAVDDLGDVVAAVGEEVSA